MKRADILLVEQGLFPSRQKAIEAIKRSDVSTNGKKLLKDNLSIEKNTE